jgi:hypothetical protein
LKASEEKEEEQHIGHLLPATWSNLGLKSLPRRTKSESSLENQPLSLKASHLWKRRRFNKFSD